MTSLLAIIRAHDTSSDLGRLSLSASIVCALRSSLRGSKIRRMSVH